jgi:hypothetical protein
MCAFDELEEFVEGRGIKDKTRFRIPPGPPKVYYLIG